MPLPSVILPGYLARGTDYRWLEKALNEQGIKDDDRSPSQTKLAADDRETIGCANFTPN